MCSRVRVAESPEDVSNHRLLHHSHTETYMYIQQSASPRSDPKQAQGILLFGQCPRSLVESRSCLHVVAIMKSKYRGIQPCEPPAIANL